MNAQFTTSHLMEIGKLADGTPVKATVITMNEGFKTVNIFHYIPLHLAEIRTMSAM